MSMWFLAGKKIIFDKITAFWTSTIFRHIEDEHVVFSGQENNF